MVLGILGIPEPCEAKVTRLGLFEAAGWAFQANGLYPAMPWAWLRTRGRSEWSCGEILGPLVHERKLCIRRRQHDARRTLQRAKPPLLSPEPRVRLDWRSCKRVVHRLLRADCAAHAQPHDSVPVRRYRHPLEQHARASCRFRRRACARVSKVRACAAVGRADQRVVSGSESASSAEPGQADATRCDGKPCRVKGSANAHVPTDGQSCARLLFS